MPQAIKNTVINSTEFVGHQDGAVVSKTLLAKKAGSVTLFSFDTGQGLSEHMAPYDALVQVLEGEMDIIISGTQNTMHAGELIIMPADAPHALTAKKPLKIMLVMIKSSD